MAADFTKVNAAIEAAEIAAAGMIAAADTAMAVVLADGGPIARKLYLEPYTDETRGPPSASGGPLVFHSMPGPGVEPGWGCPQGILSPSRLASFATPAA